MKIWVYRPDKKKLDLDKSLLYYKGMTADKQEQDNTKICLSKSKKKIPKSHYVEVPFTN